MQYTHRLKHPFKTSHGKLVEALTLRPLNLNDMIGAQEMSGSGSEMELNRNLYASASNMKPIDFGYIDLSEDFPDLVEGYEAHLGKSNSTNQMTLEEPSAL